jgi:CheY-like chemotaxis protein
MSNPVILAVDDDKTILDSLKTQLKSLFGRRFRYEVAESAAEAWEVIDEVRSDGVRIVLVVSDWLMPDVKGDEFLTSVRERDPEIACIMLTGYADQAAVNRIRDNGIVDRLLFKPWSQDDLREAIEAMVTEA